MLTSPYACLFVQTRRICEFIFEVALQFMLNLVVPLSLSFSFFFLSLVFFFLGCIQRQVVLVYQATLHAFQILAKCMPSHYCRNLNSMTWISFGGKWLIVHSPLDGCRS